MKKTTSLAVLISFAVITAAIVPAAKKINGEKVQRYATAFISELNRNKY